MTTSGPPSVSVIVASELEEGHVRRCLASLMPQARRWHAEVIVAQGVRPLKVAWLQTEFPDVRVLHVRPGQSIPELRYAGLAHARGDIVAMTEASALFPDGWLQEVIQAHLEGFDAVGGPIDPDPAFNLTNWAAHLCEYGRYMSPVRDGPGQDFSGFNASYRRSLVAQCEESIRCRYWETVLHQEVKLMGGVLALRNGMRLINTRRYSIREFVRQRFTYGRDYGRVRAGRIPLVAHLGLLLLTGGLPLLMLCRYARWIVARRLPWRRAAVAWPLLTLFAAAWSLGEWWGYVQVLRPDRSNARSGAL